MCGKASCQRDLRLKAPVLDRGIEQRERREEHERICVNYRLLKVHVINFFVDPGLQASAWKCVTDVGSTQSSGHDSLY